MQIIEYPIKEKINIPKCVLALGFFDGVHLAHRDLLCRAKKIANERGLAFGVFTFGSGGAIKNGTARLYEDSEKAEIFASLGADLTVISDFGAISGSSPEEFVKDILVRDLNCALCVAGFNFRFGKGAKADSNTLKELMLECGGDAIILEEITVDGKTLSATLIRGLISDGKIEDANRYLGSPYYIKGRVLHGRRDGHKLGFPTANINIDEGRIIPRLGVYRTAMVIDEKIYSCVSNVGTCPTFDGQGIRLETHIIGFEGDLYGREMCIYLLGFLRDERKFDSLEELSAQIDYDKTRAINENGEITWQELGLK